MRMYHSWWPTAAFWARSGLIESIHTDCLCFRSPPANHLSKELGDFFATLDDPCYENGTPGYSWSQEAQASVVVYEYVL